ncbi:MAG: Methionine aminopeptidase 2 [Marteilia pararefringens]
MRDKMKAGVDLAKFCEELEENVYKLVKEDGCRANMAFPTGVSVNECAAHYTPDIEESCIVQDGDIVKIDFGVHVNGHLVDSAFTVNLNPKIENLRLATIAATNEGLKLAGPDAYISDITERIYETITSYEVQDSNGNILPVKCIENLNGHQIEPYIIHAGKTIPLVKGSHNKPGRMEVGEQYAIETFASINGNGHVNERGQSTHFMIAPGMLNSRPKMDSVNQLLKHIRENHSSLAFCQRFIHRKYKAFSKSKLNWCLNNLVTNNILNDYPPLCDKKGSMTSQMEHTLFVKENGAEIVTRGSDY